VSFRACFIEPMLPQQTAKLPEGAQCLLHYPTSPVPQVENELEGENCEPDLGSG
jgi:hypothetical protein